MSNILDANSSSKHNCSLPTWHAEPAFLCSNLLVVVNIYFYYEICAMHTGISIAWKWSNLLSFIYALMPFRCLLPTVYMIFKNLSISLIRHTTILVYAGMSYLNRMGVESNPFIDKSPSAHVLRSTKMCNQMNEIDVHKCAVLIYVLLIMSSGSIFGSLLTVECNKTTLCTRNSALYCICNGRESFFFYSNDILT